MEKVTGIGGFFFRAQDPQALSKWYTDNLGIDPVPTSYDVQPWEQEAGSTVFAPFPTQNDMIPDGKQWMINFRVVDLNKIVAQLQSNGITVTLDENEYPNGRFATLHDPEGNGIQLWQPK